jgi:hypothetical protein
MYGREPLKTPFHKRRKYPYFAFISDNGQQLAVAVEARDLEDARYTVRALLKGGQWATSVVRLRRNDERTAKWLEHYPTPKPYPSQGA